MKEVSRVLWDKAAAALAKVRRKLIKQSMDRAKEENVIVLTGDLTSGVEDGFTYHHVNSLRLVDGDTIKAEIDLGFKCYTSQKLRFALIDLPESSTEAGPKCTELFLVIFSKLYVHYVRTLSQDKYGRWLSYINVDKLGDLNTLLLARKIGKPYKGEKKPTWSKEDLAESINAMNRLIVEVSEMKIDP